MIDIWQGWKGTLFRWRDGFYWNALGDLLYCRDTSAQLLKYQDFSEVNKQVTEMGLNLKKKTSLIFELKKLIWLKSCKD